MKKNLLNLKTMVMALAMLFAGAANAFTVVTSGNWSSAATWGGVAPGLNVLNADIIIPAGMTVTLDTDVTFTGGLLNTFSVNGTLTSTTNNKLMITQGILTGSGTISIRKIMFSGLISATYSGVLNVNEMVNSSTSLALVSTANVTDSLILEAGSLMLNPSSNLSLMTGSTIKVNNGTIATSGSGIFNSSNNYNLMYVGTSKTSGIELNSTTVQNLYLSMNSNSESVTLAANTTVNNNLNLNRGKLVFNGKKLTLKGDFIMNSGAELTSNTTSDMLIEGSGAMTSSLMFSSSSALNNFTINRTGTVKLASAQNVSGTLELMNGTLSLESGAALTMNANSTVNVAAGSMTSNTGNFIGTAAYNVNYMGSTNANSGLELSGSGLKDVAVNYTASNSKVMLGNNVLVSGNLKMMNGQMDLNGRNLTLNGSLTQTAGATFIGNAASELNLNLTSSSTTTLYFDNSSTANQTVSKLRVNLSSAAPVVMLGSNLNIKNELTFVKGKVMIDNSDLTIESTGLITGYDQANYVVTTGTGTGRLKMNVTAGSAFVTFPVGTSGNYSPAYIQQTSAATSGNITVKAMNDVMTAGTTGYSIGTLSAVQRTWFIEAESGMNVNMNLKLGWVAAAEVNGFNRNNAMIRHYTNGNWDTYTTGSATASSFTTFELSRTGITSLSPFAVSDNSAALKVNELSNLIEFSLFPNPAKDVVSIKLPKAGDSYNYQLIDITGRTIQSGEESKNNINLKVADIQPGYYFVKITNLNDNSTGTKRFIKD